MSTVSNDTNPLASLYKTDEKTVKTGTETSELTQEDFFSLLTEQLANQDPSKPVDNDQMVAQMTSFSMAQGITNLNENFESFAASMTSNQALQASSLIGQSVLVLGDTGHMKSDGAGMSGMVISDQSVQNMKITITNGAGEVVKTIDAGTQAAGNVEFEWDGTDANGNPMAAGAYHVSAQGKVNGDNTALTTGIYRNVDSVSLASSNQGIVLNLDGDESISLSDALSIGG